MTKQDSKYLFNLNDFNEPDPEELEDEEPPPPTFSEEELEQARNSGYQQGKADGLAESKASRDQYIAGLLGQISQRFETLFAAEQNRENIFENEAIVLALATFKKVFPLLNEQNGLEEVKHVIQETLTQLENQSKIIIEVCEEDAKDVEQHIKTITPTLENVVVTGSSQLKKGDCAMKWENGGATRDSEEVAEKILMNLEQTLDGAQGNVQNGEKELEYDDKNGDVS